MKKGASASSRRTPVKKGTPKKKESLCTDEANAMNLSIDIFTGCGYMNDQLPGNKEMRFLVNQFRGLYDEFTGKGSTEMKRSLVQLIYDTLTIVQGRKWVFKGKDAIEINEEGIEETAKKKIQQRFRDARRDGKCVRHSGHNSLLKKCKQDLKQKLDELNNKKCEEDQEVFNLTTLSVQPACSDRNEEGNVFLVTPDHPDQNLASQSSHDDDNDDDVPMKKLFSPTATGPRCSLQSGYVRAGYVTNEDSVTASDALGCSSDLDSSSAPALFRPISNDETFSGQSLNADEIPYPDLVNYESQTPMAIEIPAIADRELDSLIQVFLT